MTWARFDDLRAGTAIRCPEPDRVLVAERPDEVVGVLAEVERATESGRWAFGYVAYEAAAGLDPHLVVHPSTPMGMPLVWFGICDEPTPVPPLEAAGEGLLTTVRPGTAAWHPAWTPAGHAAGVARIRERIAAGDTFRCNLTVRMAGRVTGDPVALYRDLALGQCGAFNACLDLGRFVVASASPELFLERRGDRVLLRPMKSTARRGRHRSEDRHLAVRLRASEKERAGNVMIVDLVRNDVARVAEIGQRRGAGAVRHRALRDGAPADVRRHRPAATRHRAGGAVPGLVRLRLGHGCPEGELHGDHPRRRGGAPRRVLRSHRSGGAAGRAGPAPAAA